MTTITEVYRLLFGRTSLFSGNVIDMAEHGRAGGVSSGQPFKFIDTVNYAVKITEVGDILYIAYANPGTLGSEAKWQVRKLDTTTGIVLTWCDSDTNFDNIATDLTALTYG